MPWTLTSRAVIISLCSCKSESVLHVVGKGKCNGRPFFTKNDAGRLLFPAVRGRSCVVLIGNSHRHEVAVYLGNSPRRKVVLYSGNAPRRVRLNETLQRVTEIGSQACNRDPSEV